MSKTQLKKELQTLDAEALRELILDLYEADKGAKAYLDFFVNPDVEKLHEKLIKNVNREFARSKWGRSKARISVIRKLLKEFAAFQPGFEAVIEAQTATLRTALAAEEHLYYPDTLTRGVTELMLGLTDYADKNLVLDRLLEELGRMLGPKGLGSKSMRATLSEQLNAHLSEIKPEITKPSRK